MACTVFCLKTLFGSREGSPCSVLDDDAALLLNEAPGGQLVNAIGPVGTDAVFNCFQVPQLLEEWQVVVDEAAGTEAAQNLRTVKAFIEAEIARLGTPDHYALFMAD